MQENPTIKPKRTYRNKDEQIALFDAVTLLTIQTEISIVSACKAVGISYQLFDGYRTRYAECVLTINSRKERAQKIINRAIAEDKLDNPQEPEAPESVVVIENVKPQRLKNIFSHIQAFGDDEYFEPVIDDPNEFEPTDTMPGSKAKLEVMAERVRRGMPLHHPDDRNAFNDNPTD